MPHYAKIGLLFALVFGFGLTTQAVEPDVGPFLNSDYVFCGYLNFDGAKAASGAKQHADVIEFIRVEEGEALCRWKGKPTAAALAKLFATFETVAPLSK